MATDYNRQYVGARYVPQFFNNPDGSWDWAQGFQYEPLTIVKYGSNAYTSKKLVPSTVTSPNLNNEYWALTGDYNGFIQDLEAKVTKATRPKQILLIGDSYFQESVSPATTMISNLGLTLNVQAWIYYKGGAGFSLGGYEDELNLAKAGIPDFEKNVDEIYVCCATNDLNHTATEIEAGMTSFKNALNYDIPVNVIFYGLHKQYSSEIVKSSYYKKCCDFGWSYHDLQPINHDYTRLADVAHPISAVYPDLGDALTQIYLTGDYQLPPLTTTTPITLLNGFSGGTANIVQTRLKEGVKISVELSAVTIPTLILGNVVTFGNEGNAPQYVNQNKILTIVSGFMTSGGQNANIMGGRITQGNKDLILQPFNNGVSASNLYFIAQNDIKKWDDSV